MRLSFLYASLTFQLASHVLATEARYWENWDDPQVAQVIDSYWISNCDEIQHRELLAALMAPFLTPSTCILEVGSGTGLVYEKLLPLMTQKNYTGIDNSSNMLTIAKARFPQARFLKADVFNLPFEEDSFDIVTAFEVFGHLNDIQIPLKEMYRIATKYVIFTVWSSPQTITAEEKILNSTFIHRAYSHQDILEKISKLGAEGIHVDNFIVREGVTAYVIHKTKTDS